MLDDLLDVSRIGRGQLRAAARADQLAAAIDHAVETAEPAIEAGRHTLSVTMPPQPLCLQGDLTRLAQVFSNVLINAAKYTPPGGRSRSRAVGRRRHRARRRHRHRHRRRAHGAASFEIFGQGQSALDRAQGGQGIGLSLAKGLIEMHGGSIEARSDGLGKGSEFVMRLPLD